MSKCLNAGSRYAKAMLSHRSGRRSCVEPLESRLLLNVDTPTIDYGDAPASYEVGAAEIAEDLILYIGSEPDAESAPLHSMDGLGDDDDNVDDEDLQIPPLTPGTTASFTVVPHANAGIIRAWIDFNRDGSFDHLTEALADPLTASNQYTVDDVDLDQPYLIEFAVPAGAVAGETFLRIRTNDFDSPIGGETSLGEVEDHQVAIVEETQVGSIDVAVFLDDIPQNGMRDVDEPNLTAFPISVEDAAGNVLTKETDASGFAQFELPVGVYTTRLGLLLGGAYDATTPAEWSVQVTADGTVEMEFGIARRAGTSSSISGVVFHDANDDGVFDPYVESVIPNATLTLAGIFPGATPTSTVSDDQGVYIFDGIAAGTYRVTAFLNGESAEWNVMLEEGARVIDAHVSTPLPIIGGGEIAGHIFADFNGDGIGDGIEDGEDIPMSGVAELTDSNETHLYSYHFDTSGEFRFTNIPPGEYTISVSTDGGLDCTNVCESTVQVEADASTDLPHYGFLVMPDAPSVTGDLHNFVESSDFQRIYYFEWSADGGIDESTLASRHIVARRSDGLEIDLEAVTPAFGEVGSQRVGYLAHGPTRVRGATPRVGPELNGDYELLYRPGGLADANGNRSLAEIPFDQFLIELEGSLDFGDAPDSVTAMPNLVSLLPISYPTLLPNGAHHMILDGLSLGATNPDAELNGQPSVTATGDDAFDDFDDENGVEFDTLILHDAFMGEGIPVVFRGQSFDVQINVNMPSNVETAYVSGWFDFNRANAWNDVADFVVGPSAIEGSTTMVANLQVPIDAEVGLSFARFRLGTEPLHTTMGAAANGEVEDYVFRIVDPPDFGDAPDETIGPGFHYPTRQSENGARHFNSVRGFHLGERIDFEEDGMPNSNALDDDEHDGFESPSNNNLDDPNNPNDPDDEDGITFHSPAIPGKDVLINVRASVVDFPTGLLDAWFDFDRNGDWDIDEQIFASEPIVNGDNLLSFHVPEEATPGPSYARFRLSREGGLQAFGPAMTGEVEDYLVDIKDSFEAHVVEVLVSGSDWTDEFRDAVDEGRSLGYSIPLGVTSQLGSLPWGNANQLHIRFSEDINITEFDVQIVGVERATYPFTFHYDAITTTARLTLTDGQSFGVDTILVAVSEAILPGNGSLSTPSQNATSMAYRFNLFPGDTNQSGVAAVNDLGLVRLGLGHDSTHANYSILADTNGSGSVAVDDIANLRTNLGRSLPKHDPILLPFTKPMLPRIDVGWWSITGDAPDLSINSPSTSEPPTGPYTYAEDISKNVADFTIWKDDYDLWHVVACVLKTTAPGERLLYEWTTSSLQDTNWTEKGVFTVPRASFPFYPAVQAPHTTKWRGDYYMFYNTGGAARAMFSDDGNYWTPLTDYQGSNAFFEVNRDVQISRDEPNSRWIAYYVGESDTTGPNVHVVAARTANDFLGPWSTNVNAARTDGNPESPFVLQYNGFYYLFQQMDVLVSSDPMSFPGPPATTLDRFYYAPEIIEEDGEFYIAAYRGGLFVAKLEWMTDADL